MDTKITAPQLRCLAADIVAAYADDFRDNRNITAQLVADKMVAEANLIDAKSGQNTTIAAEYHTTQILPLLGSVHIKGGGSIIKIDRPYRSEGKKQGIYVNFSRTCDPVAAERDGHFNHIYIGTEKDGPLAHYAAASNQWYECTSHGNFGKNYACGGNWSSKKVDQAPEIFNQLEKIMDQATKIAQTEAKLAAAKLMLHANTQDQGAAAHLRQAAHPAYDGQDAICVGKAATWAAQAEITRAKAGLLLAQAGL